VAAFAAAVEQALAAQMDDDDQEVQDGDDQGVGAACH
jgi:hypothetical protein